jgi:hypothetical protein
MRSTWVVGALAAALLVSAVWNCQQHSAVASLSVRVEGAERAADRAALDVRRLAFRLDALEDGWSSTVGAHTDDAARDRFKQAVELYDLGEYEQARVAFLDAYAAKKHPAVLLDLAWACLKSGHTMEAEGYFGQVVADPDTTTKQRDSATDGLRQARAPIAQAEPPPAPSMHVAMAVTDTREAFLNINSIPPSTCILDGVVLGGTPRMKVSVKPGKHTVQFVDAEHNATSSVTVSVAAGETKQAVSKLALAAAPPASSQPHDGF